MATDKSEPRVGLIFRIGLLVIVLLVSIRALLNTYFDQIASAEELRKFGQVVQHPLLNLRADEEQRLTGGPMPVDKAMRDLVARGRMGDPDIAPSASRDMAPMQGWSKLPLEVPSAMMAPPPEPVPAAPASSAGPHSMTAPPGSATPHMKVPAGTGPHPKTVPAPAPAKP